MLRSLPRLLAWALAMLSLSFGGAALAQPLSRHSAVLIAEKFVAENGYTDLPPENLKSTLDREPLEWSTDRSTLLRFRYNTLKPRAIGIRSGRKGAAGWSVAFDFVNAPGVSPEICRVVTMNMEGSDVQIQHVDGVRAYFAGFN